jgi:tryptophan synthase beta chain
LDNSFHDLGKFGKYGGKYIPETLVPAINELESAYERYKNEPSFIQELGYYLTRFAGRPTPLYFAKKSDRVPWGVKDLLETRRSFAWRGA